MNCVAFEEGKYIILWRKMKVNSPLDDTPLTGGRVTVAVLYITKPILLKKGPNFGTIFSNNLPIFWPNIECFC